MTPSGSPRVLLTGAAGFVGSRIARRLIHRGCTVIGLVRGTSDCSRLDDVASEVRFVHADLYSRDEVDDAIRGAAPDVLVHAAWHVRPDTYLHDVGNIRDLQASLDLFEQARRHGCHRIVGVGTCLEYDVEYGWLHEEIPLRPKSLYASSKAALFLAASAWARETGISLAWVRLFSQYGPGEDVRRLIPSVIGSLRDGSEIAVASGDQVRDYLHVDDVASAIAAVALCELEGPVNVGSGRPKVVQELVQIIEEKMDRAGLVQFAARPNPPGEPAFICADIRRLRKALGWQPEIGLEQGLMETIRWWTRDVGKAQSTATSGHT